MGLFGFLGFGKKEKPNLVSAVARPQAAQLFNNKTLRDIAQKRLTTGEGLGFGEDYMSRTANPVIAQREARFKNKEIPFLSSQLSARNMARSAGPNLATDVFSQAFNSKERDVDEILSKFYTLNEAQKKQDYGQALQLGQNLDQQEAGLLSDAAAEGERVRDLTVGRANTNNENSLKRQNQTLGTLMNMVVPGSGMAFSFPTQPSSQDANPSSLVQQGPSQNILGSISYSQLNAMNIQDILKLFGG